jgi:hypothetical protein
VRRQMQGHAPAAAAAAAGVPFKTQGSVYELTASRIESFGSFGSLTPVMDSGIGTVTVTTIPTPVAVTISNSKTEIQEIQEQEKHMQKPGKPAVLVRKSTLYQSATATPNTSYVKYGNSDDDDDDGDDPDDSDNNDGKGGKINFDNAHLKETMKSMKLSAATNTTTTTAKPRPTSACATTTTKDVVTKRFPSPATSATTNQLFWCVYIACKGEAAFDMISNAFVTETEFKYETVELIRGMRLLVKPLFKKHKLSLPNFEAELISSKRTTLQVMTGILICHQKNLLYIDHRMFIEIKARDSEQDDADADVGKVWVVIEKVKNRHCVYADTECAKLAQCRAELLKMESLDSPVRSASYYKLGELEDMCKRLALVLPATGTKKADLYSEILKYIENSGIRV